MIVEGILTTQQAVQQVLETEVVDLVLLNPKQRVEQAMALMRPWTEESAIPLIILTDCREEADRVMGLEMGADDYLTKPSVHASFSRASGPCCAAVVEDIAVDATERAAMLPLRRPGTA